MRSEFKIQERENHGFLYPLTVAAIRVLHTLCAVEWFKFAATRIVAKKGAAAQRLAERNAVDVFIVLKWLAVTILISCEAISPAWTVFVWYLILTNVFSYFYHHVWCEEAVYNAPQLVGRTRRRFLLMLQAVAFSQFSFAYLYFGPLRAQMNWGANLPSIATAIPFSVSSAVAGNYDFIQATGPDAQLVMTIQFVISFLFLSIILTKSIPASEKDNGIQK